MAKVTPVLDLDKTERFHVKVRDEIKEVYVGDIRIETYVELNKGVEKRKIKIVLVEV